MERRECGITLVALVVTIIVLLILAGVTIALSYGVIEKAKYAREETVKRMAEEEIKVAVMEAQVNKLGEASLRDLVEVLKSREDIYIITTHTRLAKLSKEEGIQEVEELSEKADFIYVTNMKYDVEVKVTDKFEVMVSPNQNVDVELTREELEREVEALREQIEKLKQQLEEKNESIARLEEELKLGIDGQKKIWN